MSLDVEIGRLPDDQAASQQPASSSAEPSSAPLGLTVEPLPAEAAASMGVSGGVVVANVAPGPALNAGIRPRDIITELNRKPVRSVDDFRKVVQSMPDDRPVSVRVVRQGRATYLVMKPAG
jgi:serine protease Do